MYEHVSGGVLPCSHISALAIAQIVSGLFFLLYFLVSSVIIVKSDLGYIGRGSRHEFLWFRTY